MENFEICDGQINFGYSTTHQFENFLDQPTIQDESVEIVPQ